jgi:transcriptional regulator with XRE-family HTH domain
MDRSFYSRVETGEMSPRVDRLWDIAAALQVPITELFREPS